MTDYFALLDELRRPWLDPEALKEKFLTLSNQQHPDKIGSNDPSATARFTDLNAAYQVLRDPKERLLHLLTLESGAKPKEVQQIPGASMELFVTVANACRKADTFLAKKIHVTSPLLKVQWFEEAQGYVEELQTLQRQLNSRKEALESELQSLSREWESKALNEPRWRTQTLARLEELYRAFSYFNKWSSQLQERLVQLSLV